MKILMLADVFFPDTVGGAGRVVFHLSRELSKKGHEVHIITRNTNGELPARQKLGSNLFVHRFFTPRKESLRLFLSEIRNSYFLAKDLAREIDFDLLCIHQSLVALGPLISGCFRFVPAIYYFHSPWHEEFLVKRQEKGKKGKKSVKTVAFFMRWIEKRILLKTARVIVLSQYMFNRVTEIHGYQERKIVKISGGVDLNRFHLEEGGKAAAKSRMKLPLDRTVFLTVRNLVPRMGIENLIEAFNRSDTLRRKGSLLIGGQGFLENRLKAMVENYKLQQTICFLGHIPDPELPGTYQAADFFVLPTRRLEGFGLVILEAMASGTPVLGTPVGAIPEVIGAFDERLIFKGTGWRDIKKKMEEVIEWPEQFQCDPKACRRFVKESFSWEKVATVFEEEMIRVNENGVC